MTTTVPTTPRSARTKKRGVYAEVTDRIVSLLQAGTVPWRQPWNARSGRPRNHATGKAYRGINVWLLLAAAWESGYASPEWMTYKQAQASDGQVRKGERSTMVVFFKPLEGVDKATGEERKIIVLRNYRVFNVAQIDGIDVLEPHGVEHTESARHGAADAIASRYLATGGPSLRHGSPIAEYDPNADRLVMPDKESFHTLDDCYATLFHELTHSTAHPSRLNRKAGSTFGSHDYGVEELCAEMGAAFLSATAGITQTQQSHAAYLQAWINTISEDKRIIVTAAAQAQKAADHIVGDEPPDNG